MYDGLKNLDVPRRPHAGTKRALRLGGISALVAVLGICSYGAYVYKRINSNIGKSKVAVANLKPEVPGEAMNILVVGSDQRSVVGGSERDQRQFRGGSGARTDTIMLLHIAAKAERAVLVSFPRDLLVMIPGHTGKSRINSAYSADTFKDGGRDLLIKTVKSISGIEINHYIEINFASFQSIVNALGGVSIYFPKKVSDEKSGLDIKKSGCVRLDGNMALSYVRARHIYASADLGRIQAQQRFIRAIVGKAKSVGTLLNPTKWLAVSDAVTSGLVVDKRVSAGLAFGIARKLSDQSKLDFRIFPGSTRAGSPYVYPNLSEASAFFAALAADQPLPAVGKTGQSLPEPADVTIKVLNGTSKSGWGARAKTALVKQGFEVGVVATAPAPVEKTILRYQPGEILKAELVARQYPGAELRLASNDQYQDVVITLGADTLPVVASPGASPGASPDAKPTTKATKSGKVKKPVAGAACG